MKLNIKDMTAVAVMAALICVAAPFTIPAGPIPLSLATLMIYIASASGGKKRGTLAVLLYILLGAAGLPVFSGFQGGLHKLAGPTGGYIIGYIFCAFITAAVTETAPEKIWLYPVGMALGTAVLYTFGTVWFMCSIKRGLGASLALCVLPFLVGDAIKIAAAAGVSYALRRRVFAKLS